MPSRRTPFITPFTCVERAAMAGLNLSSSATGGAVTVVQAMTITAISGPRGSGNMFIVCMVVCMVGFESISLGG